MADNLPEAVKMAHDWMESYMKSFYSDDAEIHRGIILKEEHTGYVVTVARELARHLDLSEHGILLAELMGLMHDVGRFRQWEKYLTFDDARSEDHADLGVGVIEGIPFFAMLSDRDRSLLLFAIKNHNKKAIEPAPDEEHLMFAKLLRDADKVDIYRILEPQFGPPVGDGYAPGFEEQFANGEQVDYLSMRTKDDRKLVRLMWVYDINYAWTLRRICQKGYIDKIADKLARTPLIDIGLEKMRQYIEKKCAEQDVA